MNGHGEVDTPRPMAHITVVGAGLHGLGQLTLDGVKALRRARVVFSSPANGNLIPFLRRVNPSAEQCGLEDDEYRYGTWRPAMYSRMAERVLRAAEEGRGVVVLEPGSAWVVDAVTQRLVDGGRERGLDVTVLPGVSCIEAVSAALGWDAGQGLQVILAQRLMLYRLTLDPALAALVIQPGYFDTRWWLGSPEPNPVRFEPLVDRLSSGRSPASPVALVHTAAVEAERDHVVWLRLRDLVGACHVISPLHSLFLPPVSEPRVDAAFARRIDDKEAALADMAADPQHQRSGTADPAWSFPVDEVLTAPLLAQHAELAEDWERRLAVMRSGNPMDRM